MWERERERGAATKLRSEEKKKEYERQLEDTHQELKEERGRNKTIARHDKVRRVKRGRERKKKREREKDNCTSSRKRLDGIFVSVLFMFVV